AEWRGGLVRSAAVDRVWVGGAVGGRRRAVPGLARRQGGTLRRDSRRWAGDPPDPLQSSTARARQRLHPGTGGRLQPGPASGPGPGADYLELSGPDDLHLRREALTLSRPALSRGQGKPCVSCRAITVRSMSLVPSPIAISGASR